MVTGGSCAVSMTQSHMELLNLCFTPGTNVTLLMRLNLKLLKNKKN